MRHLLQFEPARVFAIIAAALALLAHFLPNLPVPLVLGLAAAILGLGEGVRSSVTPVAKLRQEDPPR